MVSCFRVDFGHGFGYVCIGVWCLVCCFRAWVRVHWLCVLGFVVWWLCFWILPQDEEERTFSGGGEFLPLEAWAVKGFDTERIKSNTPSKDVKWSAQLGWVYRVVIDSESHTRRKTQTEVLTLVNQKRRGTGAQGESPTPHAKRKAAPAAIADRQPSSTTSSSSDDDSSSSTSSSASPARPAETPTRQVLREEQERARAKAQAKASAKAAAAQAKGELALKTRATRLRAKLVGALNGLRAVVQHPLIPDVPANISESVRAYLHAFERMVNECDLIASGAASAWAECLNEVPWKEAKTAEKLLLSMLRSVSKAKSLKF